MNPELRRYAWLELGGHRLLTGPLVLGALAVIPLASSDAPAQPLAWGAFWLFLLLTVGWGSLRALASVTDEVRDRTWDFQRMAAFTPAALALGKVFGAPLYQWYLGLWCLAALAAAGTVAGLRALGSLLVGIVAAAVLLHALGVALSTAGARARMGERTRRAGGVLLVLGLLQSLPMAALLWRKDPGAVRWWGWGLPAETFAAASLLLFAGWAVLAACRAMLRELQEPARPWPWPAFAAVLALWWAGLSTPTHDRPGFGSAAGVAAWVLALATYVACLMDPLTRVGLARMARAWQPQASRWQARAPAWLLHAGLAVAAGALAFLGARGDTLAAFALPVALMALRDAAVVSCFALASSSRSPVGRAVFYIALADLLVPTLALAVHLPALAQAAFPLWGMVQEPARAAWGMGLHAIVACAVLAFFVVRARRADAAARPPA